MRLGCTDAKCRYDLKEVTRSPMDMDLARRYDRTSAALWRSSMTAMNKVTLPLAMISRTVEGAP